MVSVSIRSEMSGNVELSVVCCLFSSMLTGGAGPGPGPPMGQYGITVYQSVGLMSHGATVPRCHSPSVTAALVSGQCVESGQESRTRPVPGGRERAPPSRPWSRRTGQWEAVRLGGLVRAER